MGHPLRRPAARPARGQGRARQADPHPRDPRDRPGRRQPRGDRRAPRPRIQGMSFGPADLAASRRMKTTRVGGGHPGYRTIADPDPENPEAARPSAQQDPWHYSIARMVDACTARRSAAVLRPVRRHQGRRGLRDAVPRRVPARLRRRLVAAPGADRHRQEGLLARPRRGQVRQEGHRGDPRRPRRAHDRRQDAGRRHLEAVPRSWSTSPRCWPARTRSSPRPTSSSRPPPSVGRCARLVAAPRRGAPAARADGDALVHRRPTGRARAGRRAAALRDRPRARRQRRRRPGAPPSPLDEPRTSPRSSSSRPPGKQMVLRVNRLFWADGEDGIKRFQQIVARHDAARVRLRAAGPLPPGRRRRGRHRQVDGLRAPRRRRLRRRPPRGRDDDHQRGQPRHLRRTRLTAPTTGRPMRWSRASWPRARRPTGSAAPTCRSASPTPTAGTRSPTPQFWTALAAGGQAVPPRAGVRRRRRLPRHVLSAGDRTRRARPARRWSRRSPRSGAASCRRPSCGDTVPIWITENGFQSGAAAATTPARRARCRT